MASVDVISQKSKQVHIKISQNQ